MLQLHSVKIKVKGSDIQVDSLAQPIETKCDYLTEVTQPFKKALS